MAETTETVELDVSSEFVALEVGYALIGRAGKIHNNPGDDFEDTAIELKDLGQEIINEYEENKNSL